MPVTQSVVKHGLNQYMQSFLQLYCYRYKRYSFLRGTTNHECALSILWDPFFFSHLSPSCVFCIFSSVHTGLHPKASSTIWRLNSSLLVAMKGMLNTALMCNLSLHKHYRSRPTPGINATDLSYTSRAQLEEMGGGGVGGGWLFEGDLFNLNLNLHRALCKCVQADIFALSSCLDTKCSWQNRDAFYRGGRIQVCGR